MKVAFVTWDGPDQNYMESLFLPIFARMARHRDDLEFTTLQFTWDFDTTSVARASAALGFGYEAADVLRRPLSAATALMIAAGARRVVDFANRQGVDVLMPRSVIPAAMVLLARRALPGIRVLFDADGFVADERVEFAGWSPQGVTYRLFRDIEAQTTRIADAVIVRTRRAREILIARAGAGVDPTKVFVVSNGKDDEAFRTLTGAERSAVREGAAVPRDVPWVAYVGSLGPQYHPAEMLRFFELLLQQRGDARFLCMTGQVDDMSRLVRERNLTRHVDVRRVPPDQVPRYLGSADVGLALREPSFSQRGVAPIKVGEYLLTGLPVVATRGVGDVDEQVDADVGLLLERLDDEALQGAARWFLAEVLDDRDGFRERCRARGVQEFGMDQCAARYLAALDHAVFGAR